MSHAELVKAAKDAIEALFADRSVSPEQSADDLEELAADIDSMIDAIKADLK